MQSKYNQSRKSNYGVVTVSGKLEGVELPIALPPLNEQKLIVEKIDELFSLADNTIHTLEKIKKQIGILEKSVFHSSFIGTVSSIWRDKNPTVNSNELLNLI